MHVFRNEVFEFGLRFELLTPEDIRRLFKELRECPDCAQYREALAEIEAVVWKAYRTFCRDSSL